MKSYYLVKLETLIYSGTKENDVVRRLIDEREYTLIYFKRDFITAKVTAYYVV
jgi:hypothetical protein